MGSIAMDDNTMAGEQPDVFAVIGLATRFPDEATDTENLWRFLLKGRSAHTPFPEDRIGPGHYHPDPEHGGSHAVQGAHFMSEDPGYFDAPFFSITKGEATSMDPQQRLVLENVYLALENSGLSLSKISGSNTSVYVSGFNHDHLSIINADPESTQRYRATGLTNSVLSNRVSWFFDFKGPSMTIDTACSSSMVTLHQGCQSLRTGETDMAISTGVTVITYPNDLAGMSHQGLLGRHGRSFSFDHRADGYARSEGVGTVVVKRLADAIRDGNTIRAIIRGTGVNQDGRTPGLTLPDSLSQERLIKQVYASAKLDLNETMLIEAHGTGTAAGDPIEANGIARAFASRRNKTPLYVGALKSGLGHLEGAAGVAAIIKSILILEEGIIPPNVNFEKVNPKIPAKKWNLQFPLEPVPWPSTGRRRISINSFGVGGTNAHVVMDDAFHYLAERGIVAPHHTRPVLPTLNEISKLVKALHQHPDQENDHHSDETAAENGLINGNSDSIRSIDAVAKWNSFPPIQLPPKIFPITSFDEEGVSRIAKSQSDYLQSKDQPNGDDEVAFLEDYAYTMAERSQFPWRSFVIGDSIPHLVENYTQSLPKQVRARGPISIGFVFTGQGAQWYGMARELLCYPVFRKALADASSYFQLLGAQWSLLEELAKSKSESNINEAYLAQPACTAIQIAIVDLLHQWNICPSRVVGHSSGEIAAAYTTGKLDRESSWKVAYYRGLVSGRPNQRNGAMMAVGLGQESLQQYLERVNGEHNGELVIACINSPKNCTVSGDEHKIDALKVLLDEDAVFARKLNVKNAYHSSHTRDLANQYLELLGKLNAPSFAPFGPVEMFSTVSGVLVESNLLDADYWIENLVSPVRFSESLAAMCFNRTQKGQASLRTDASAGNVFADILMEIGPHGALQSAVKDILVARPEGSTVTSVAVLNRSNPGAQTILSSVGSLHSRGYDIDFNVVNNSVKTGYKHERLPQRLVLLPGYKFNHTQRFWYESRLSRNYRLRKHPRHDLFGAPIPDWNAETPRWRNILRISEQPWLRDHVVTNTVILPGVGYLIAVLEAARQICDPEEVISGFRIRDVSLKRALIVPDTKDGVEVMLAFNRVDESSLAASSTWRRFQITSYNPLGDDWIEHCTGYVAVDYETAPGPVDNGREAREESEAYRSLLNRCEQECINPINFAQAYENLVTIGLKFGPLFQNVSAVTGTPQHLGEVLGTVTVPDVGKTMPKGHISPHLIHPATMDSVMHFALASIMDATAKSNLDVAMVPTFIKDIWISAQLTPEPGHQYRAHGKSHLVAYEKYLTDVTVWDASTGEARMALRGIQATPLDSSGQGSGDVRKLCHEIEWTPYLDMATPAHFTKVVETDAAKDEISVQWTTKLQLATLLLVTDALDELGGKIPEVAKGHFIQYFEWMKQLQAWIDEDKISCLTRAEFLRYKADASAKAELYRELEQHNADGELAVRMGTNIVGVLKGETDPLHLMFGQDDILDRVYAQVAFLNQLPAQERAFLETVAKNSTNLSVLEVGAGTGSSTVGILESLAPVSEDGTQYSSVLKYTYTDISSAFFEKAKEKFGQHQAIMDYKVLDATKDLNKQGFELGTYDLVVAQNVIHATPDLVGTLGNIRHLLKPGGRLLLQEGVRQDYFWSGIAFGQLPGWWMGVESIRKWSPWVSPSQWDQVLRSAGYTGVDIELRDSQTPALHTQSLFVAQNLAGSTNTAIPWKEVALVTTVEADGSESAIVANMRSYLENGLKVPKVTVLRVSQLKNADYSHALCISLAELERPVISELSELEYDGIKQLLTVSKGLLWVTGDMTETPHYGSILGLMRSNRWERDLDDVNLIILAVKDPQPPYDILVKHIGDLCKQQFSGALPVEKYHGEYILDNGTFMTSRLQSAARPNIFLDSKFNKPKPVMTPLASAGRPIKLSSAAPGILDKLEWVTDEMYYTPLSEDEVEIFIKAVSLNFRDLMIAMGEHMAYSMGTEAAGIISRVGSNVTDLKVGDRVVYICGLDKVGCLHTYGRLEHSTVVKIPDDLSFEIAAGLPVVYATVLYSLRETGRLAKGEKILIHAAAGGVGQAAIHYAKHIGAEIFATVSTVEKRKLLIEEFGIPDDHIFSSRDLTFVKGVRRVTNDYGVDVVLNSLSGEALRRSWDLIAPFGRFIEIGKKDAQMNGKIELRPYLQNVTMASVDLVTMMKHRPVLIKQLTEDILQLWKDGVVKPATPTTIMPMSQVIEGLQILQTGKGTGKMIMVPHDEDVLPIVPAQPKPWDFRSDATYVLAGGLGGIGRSIAKWMASRGARNFVFLSSSGKITDAVQEMKSDLESIGCGIHIFKCDVSDKEQLAVVIEQCRRDLPPIKGVVQGAMKLNDCMFENMSHEVFELATKPKIQGSWNLHELLPRDMDHFIMLSSATGILGNRSQANYAAGNTFQDMLAHHRRQHGLPATTIDVGTVLSVGYVAENRERLAMAKHLGTILEVIREEEIHALLEYAMDPSCEASAQLVTGLTTMESYRSRGVPAPTYMGYPLFTHVSNLSARRSGSGDDNGGPAVEALLSAATTIDEAAAIITTAVIAKLSSLLSVAPEDISANRSVSANGVDSLVAMEFRTFLAREVKADVPVLDIMGTLSISQLCKKIAGVSKAVDVKEETTS